MTVAELIAYLLTLDRETQIWIERGYHPTMAFEINESEDLNVESFKDWDGEERIRLIIGH